MDIFGNHVSNTETAVHVNMHTYITIQISYIIPVLGHVKKIYMYTFINVKHMLKEGDYTH